jgi:hypothetical protein
MCTKDQMAKVQLQTEAELLLFAPTSLLSLGHAPLLSNEYLDTPREVSDCFPESFQTKPRQYLN